MDTILSYQKHTPLVGKIPKERVVKIGVFLTVISIVLGGIRYFTVSDEYVVDVIASSSAFALGTYLFHVGKYRIAGHLTLMVGAVGVFSMAFQDGGLYSPTLHWTPFIPLFSVLFIGVRASFFYTLAAFVALGILSYVHTFAELEFSMICSTTMFAFCIGYFYETTRLEHESKLAALASEHPLTKLPGRLLFNWNMEQAINEAVTNGTEFLLVSIDVDGLKAVNDTFGHPAGDALLIALGKRLEAAMAAGERAFHVSGDEFAVVTPSTEIAPVIARIKSVEHEPVMYLNFKITIKISIGAALGSATSDLEELLAVADSEMYFEKTSKRAVSEASEVEDMSEVSEVSA